MIASMKKASFFFKPWGVVVVGTVVVVTVVGGGVGGRTSFVFQATVSDVPKSPSR
ncbi:unnamed protein product [Haemonchus placei]|uniref:Uncharacterized protein n=1 Tax=Haemonchus placei TaxID=6290 RepID=A0A3P7VBE4_HAEPC|nr:unnamed protein product [Haemonchus placei]